MAVSAQLLSFIKTEVDYALKLVRDSIAKFTAAPENAAVLGVCPGQLHQVSGALRIVGLMMGVWFLSISVAQYFAGMIAQVASVETVGGQVTNLKVSLDTYNGVFTLIAEWAIGLGIVLLILSLPLKKWMHGVK